LARAAADSGRPELGGWRLTELELRELRFAALLHDFGKVGVPEQVLVKAERLYPSQMENLRARFEFARKSVKAHYLRERVGFFTKIHNEEERATRLEEVAEEERAATQGLDESWALILRCNRPTPLEPGAAEGLQEIARMRLVDSHGSPIRLLAAEELASLSVPRGTLNSDERLRIEQHVDCSWRFLQKIPWPAELARVPEIARGHHEKLNGQGYPDHLKGDAIPMQARIMALCDIYDALTASDRPYKSAVPHARAMEILASEVRSGGLDPVLLEIFTAARCWEHVGVKG
jgi:response regulator RpfG family c-di-GMP phosphodiesterase